MIAVVATQYWDPETFRNVYPRAHAIHAVMSKPDNVKRFIIGRQFFTVLTNFILAQIFTFANWQNEEYSPILFYIIVKSGLVGVLTILAFAQLLPELLAAEYPLRFLDMYGCYSVVQISLVFDKIGVGHCAWAIYFGMHRLIYGESLDSASKHDASINKHAKPEIIRVNSAEILAVTRLQA
jgi:hypothetical protein